MTRRLSSLLSLTDVQEALRASILDFVHRHCSPELDREIDDSSRFPTDLFEKMSALGLPGLVIPEAFGGLGAGHTEAVVVHETLTYGSLAASSALFPTTLGANLIVKGGTEAQRVELLPRLARGEIRASFALTEAGSGSDAASVTTRAERQPDGSMRLNGSKLWISGADANDLLLVAVRTDTDGPKQSGISILIVPTSAEGVTINRIPTIGLGSSSSCEIGFSDVKVAAESVLGGADGIGRGWELLRQCLDLERITLAAQSVGLAQRALDDSVDFLKNRYSKGAALSSYQALQHEIADLQTAVVAGRVLTYAVASAMDAGSADRFDVAAVKLHTTETARQVCLEAVQFHGGYGYSREYAVQRYLRRALVLTIGGGTSQIQRDLIARGMGM